LTDTLLVILFLPSIYYFLKGMKESKWQNILLGGVLLGIASLIKPIMLLFPVVCF